LAEALYLRVSTVEQTTANQERELREVAGRMGCDNQPPFRGRKRSSPMKEEERN
jgi:DNA invertase Pin-like site-specific DNA recombinase